MFSSSIPSQHQAVEGDERQIALEYIADAGKAAESDGVEPEALSHAALFAALATMVRAHGEDETARLIAELPRRILNGEYSLDRSIQ